MSDINRNDYPVNIEDIMHTAYLQYSLSVNIGRAIPDVRDGLKPANRRILYAMQKLGLGKGHAYTKSAKVVGEVIGNYHPHGDASVYDTLVRMAQDFSMREPLIDGQGNFGSIDGDPPAAYRYTECRLERLAEELLADIDKNTVGMLPTFDESTVEPEVLPAAFPNVLVNGSTGIGVGMATNIPPHNLSEVIDATVALLKNPDISITELMHFIPGPDFPTGAQICGIGEIKNLYETGRGSIKIRSKYEIIAKNENREQIIFTEIPYAVNKENLIAKIADLVNEKKITGISAVRDESSKRAGIRIVVEIKRGFIPDVVLNQLFAHTALETVFGAGMMLVDQKRPKMMNLKEILQAYVEHRLEVVTRRAKFELDKAEARAHILEGLLIAVTNIDDVVRIIRESKNKEDASISLIGKYNLSKIQADAILDMRLHQLTGLEIEELRAEFEELMKRIAELKALLADKQLRIDLIKSELEQIKQKYGNPRRTEITHASTDFQIADLIQRHSCLITVSKSGYIKRVNIEEFDVQHKGGKGIRAMETKDDDYVEHLFNADSHDIIFFFSDKGTMYWLYVYEIPEGQRTGKGKAIINLIKVEPGELIKAMITVSEKDLEREDMYVVMATKDGVIKKTVLSAFKNLRKTGIRALNIEETDDLIGVAITNGFEDIILSTAKGMACRFNEQDVRSMGRAATGVTGMKFKLKDDYVISMEAVDSSEETETDEEAAEKGGPQILVLSSGGMGKRSFFSTYRKTRRGAKGVTNMKLRDGESVIAALQVAENDEILVMTEKGQTVRVPVSEIRLVGRATKGVRIMRLNSDDKITGVVKVIEVKAEDGTASEGTEQTNG
ncbi:MAG TPA: DNA gyrase subunit A [Victivallales bacterium]|nr:DNA gyrase subunit A [Victivallales bacterium]